MAAIPAGVHAQGAPGDVPAAVATAPASAASATAPPFWVAGVVVAAAQSSAILVLLDDARREVGLITLREGESFGGYRVAAVEPSQVLLEQGGTVFPVPVGRPNSGPRGTPDAGPHAGRRPIFIPGPDKPTPDLELVRPQVRRRESDAVPSEIGGNAADPEALRDALQLLFSNPELQDTIEQMRPVIRQRLERARQDPQLPPSQGTSR